jgi:hypothetical protein
MAELLEPSPTKSQCAAAGLSKMWERAFNHASSWTLSPSILLYFQLENLAVH